MRSNDARRVHLGYYFAPDARPRNFLQYVDEWLISNFTPERPRRQSQRADTTSRTNRQLSPVETSDRDTSASRGCVLTLSRAVPLMMIASRNELTSRQQRDHDDLRRDEDQRLGIHAPHRAPPIVYRIGQNKAGNARFAICSQVAVARSRHGSTPSTGPGRPIAEGRHPSTVPASRRASRRHDRRRQQRQDHHDGGSRQRAQWSPSRRPFTFRAGGWQDDDDHAHHHRDGQATDTAGSARTGSGQAGSNGRHRQATGSRAIPTGWRAMAQTPQALKAEGRQLRQPNR
jgi:hypothetical protein